MNSFTKVFRRAHGAKEHFRTVFFDPSKEIEKRNCAYFSASLFNSWRYSRVLSSQNPPPNFVTTKQNLSFIDFCFTLQLR